MSAIDVPAECCPLDFNSMKVLDGKFKFEASRANEWKASKGYKFYTRWEFINEMRMHGIMKKKAAARHFDKRFRKEGEIVMQDFSGLRLGLRRNPKLSEKISFH